MSLAAERTYLAYVRTGLAFTAAGVAVAAALPQAGASDLRRALGAGLIILGAVTFVMARHRFLAVTGAMRRGEPLPPPRLGTIFTVALLAVVATAVVVIALA